MFKLIQYFASYSEVLCVANHKNNYQFLAQRVYFLINALNS